MEADSETIPVHSPDDSSRLSLLPDASGVISTSVLRPDEEFGRRRRCVTMSALSDFVALDGEEEMEEEEEEDGEGQEEKGQKEEQDILWMRCKDGAAGVEGNFEMRVRAKTSPACMRWYVERQVGRHLRRISDDFISHISLESRSDDSQQSDVSPRQAEVRTDSRQHPVANRAFPPSPFSSSRDSLWSRMSTYFRRAKPRIQPERVNTNDSNGLSTNAELDEVFMAADVENSPMVAMQ